MHIQLDSLCGLELGGGGGGRGVVQNLFCIGDPHLCRLFQSALAGQTFASGLAHWLVRYSSLPCRRSLPATQRRPCSKTSLTLIRSQGYKCKFSAAASICMFHAKDSDGRQSQVACRQAIYSCRGSHSSQGGVYSMGHAANAMHLVLQIKRMCKHLGQAAERDGGWTLESKLRIATPPPNRIGPGTSVEIRPCDSQLPSRGQLLTGYYRLRPPRGVTPVLYRFICKSGAGIRAPGLCFLPQRAA